MKKTLSVLLVTICIILFIMPSLAEDSTYGYCPKHPNAPLVYAVKDRYFSIDGSSHGHAKGNVLTCSVCGEEVAAVSDEEGTYSMEPHTWNDDGACTLCGYSDKPDEEDNDSGEQEYIPSIWLYGPEAWSGYLKESNFPKEVIRDRTELCEEKKGTPIELLGSTDELGGNLRERMDIINENTIIHKMHEDAIVFVHFSAKDEYGREWYYVTCDNGFEGYIVVSRIRLIEYDPRR